MIAFLTFLLPTLPLCHLFTLLIYSAAIATDWLADSGAADRSVLVSQQLALCLSLSPTAVNFNRCPFTLLLDAILSIWLQSLNVQSLVQWIVFVLTHQIGASKNARYIELIGSYRQQSRQQQHSIAHKHNWKWLQNLLQHNSSSTLNIFIFFSSFLFGVKNHSQFSSPTTEHCYSCPLLLLLLLMLFSLVSPTLDRLVEKSYLFCQKQHFLSFF